MVFDRQEEGGIELHVWLEDSDGLDVKSRTSHPRFQFHSLCVCFFFCNVFLEKVPQFDVCPSGKSGLLFFSELIHQGTIPQCPASGRLSHDLLVRWILSVFKRADSLDGSTVLHLGGGLICIRAK